MSLIQWNVLDGALLSTRSRDDPQVIKDYAEHAGLSLEVARRTRDTFFAKDLLDPDEIKGLDIVMREEINLKFIAAALTGDQLKELIQIPPRRK